jgi:hypothetical protein
LRTLQQGFSNFHPSRVVISGDRINKVTPQFLQIRKITKGERLSKKLKTESTNNEGNIEKSTRRRKITHSGRRVVGTVLRDCVRDDVHCLQNFLEAL